jgi:hypothetical protein
LENGHAPEPTVPRGEDPSGDQHGDGIDDALIQPYSSHASWQSLEISSRIAFADAQESYDQVIGRFPG